MNFKVLLQLIDHLKLFQLLYNKNDSTINKYKNQRISPELSLKGNHLYWNSNKSIKHNLEPGILMINWKFQNCEKDKHVQVMNDHWEISKIKV